MPDDQLKEEVLAITPEPAPPRFVWGVVYATRNGYVSLLMCGSEDQARAWRPFPSTSGKPDPDYTVTRKQVVKIDLPDALDIPLMDPA